MKENGFTLKMVRSRWYPAETITDAGYADDLVLYVNTPAKDESLLQSLEQTAGGIGLYMNSDKTKFVCFNEDGDNSILNIKLLKVDHFTYLGSNISFSESNVSIHIGKTWTAFDKLFIWKSNLFDKIKTGILPSWRCVNTIVWMHHFNKTLREKATWKLQY